MMPTTDNERAILARLEIAPDDPTAIADYARVLEEMADYVVGDEELAAAMRGRVELIEILHRLKELEGLGFPIPNKEETLGLIAREKELVRQHGQVWRRGPKCEACKGTGDDRAVGLLLGDKQRCPACQGSGDAGGLLQRRNSYGHEKEYPTTCAYLVEWTPFPRVHVTMMSLLIDGTTIDDFAAGETTRQEEPSSLLGAFARHPCVQVLCEDRIPVEIDGDWGWYRGISRLGSSSEIPVQVFDLLPHDAFKHTKWRWQTSPSEAIATLARAWPKWARKASQ